MKNKLIIYQKELYVTSDGEIYNSKGKLYKQKEYPSGYLYISVRDEMNKYHNLLVHRLIARAFLDIPNNFEKYDVHHIDENKQNNNVSNLKIMTKKDHQILHNQIYPLTKKCKVCGREFIPSPTKRKRAVVCSAECKHILDILHAKTRQRKINQYTLDNKFIKTWESAQEIENALGYSGSNICACCKGRLKKTYGYIWRYDIET